MNKVTMAAGAIALLAAAFSLTAPVQAGTCQTVKAKGLGKDLKQATLFAQADLKQTAKSMKGKVKQATTKCGKVLGDFHCHIDAVICPR
jgi:hypothetical protein